MKLPTMEQEAVLLRLRLLFITNHKLCRRWSFLAEEIGFSSELLQKLCEKNWISKRIYPCYWTYNPKHYYSLTALGRKVICVNKQLELSFS